MTGNRCQMRSHRRPDQLRRGSVTLELIVMLPVWLIVMGAIVQFGLLIGNRQQVALAARVGAEEASRTPGLAAAGQVPANVIGVVEQQLQSSGIQQCQITLEHSLLGGGLLSSGTCDCPTLGETDDWPPESGDFVRVTVYVPATQLAPNVLKFFGFDITERFIRNATTFRHEL